MELYNLKNQRPYLGTNKIFLLIYWLILHSAWFNGSQWISKCHCTISLKEGPTKSPVCSSGGGASWRGASWTLCLEAPESINPFWSTPWWWAGAVVCWRESWKQWHKDEGTDGIDKPLVVTSAWGTAGATGSTLLVPLGNVFNCFPVSLSKWKSYFLLVLSNVQRRSFTPFFFSMF